MGERVKSCDDIFSNAAGKRDPHGLMKRRGLQTAHSPAYGPAGSLGDFDTPPLVCHAGALPAKQGPTEDRPYPAVCRAYSSDGMNVQSCRAPCPQS
jgi:hypothetical protein